MPDNQDLIHDAEVIRPTARRRAGAEADPHTPPPRHKDRSGVVVRAAIVSALLVGAAAGYSYLARQPVEPLVGERAETAPPQQLAEGDPALIPASPSDFAEPNAAEGARPGQRTAPVSAPAEPAPVDPPSANEPPAPSPQG